MGEQQHLRVCPLLQKARSSASWVLRMLTQQGFQSTNQRFLCQEGVGNPWALGFKVLYVLRGSPSALLATSSLVFGSWRGGLLAASEMDFGAMNRPRLKAETHAIASA